MDAATRDSVRQRAGQRCEYCKLPDRALDLPFHVEHIVAVVHRLDHDFANLAWARPRCNLRKGPNLSTIDPESGKRIELFDPRTMRWNEHFAIHDGVIRGLTAIGRGTARLLDVNHEQRLQHRRYLISRQEFDMP